MATVKTLFTEYIAAIEPDTKAKRIAAKAHIIPREYLEDDEKFGEHVLGSFLYGSYKRKTATYDIKDVDIMLLTDFDPDSISPSQVLNDLFNALVRCYGSEKVLKKNRRSIQVLNPLPDEDTDLTLDILPAVELNDGTGYLLVPDKDEKEWIVTNPRGHLTRTSEKNSDENKKLVPFVKILKAWWHYQSQDLTTKSNPKPRPKSFWLETLALNFFYDLDDTWAERFLRFMRTVKDLAPVGSGIIALEDPGMTGKELKTSMSQAEFDAFMDKVRSTEAKASQALAEYDISESSKIWAEIFGDDFPLIDNDAAKELTSTEQYSLGDTSHAKDLVLPIAIQGTASISALLYRKNFDNRRLKVLVGSISSNGSIRSGTELRFKVNADFKLPADFDVYWRVVNTGKHAASKSGLRGKPFIDHTHTELVRWESTEYTGKHWIDAYIVHNGKIIAVCDKFYVNITNSKWWG